MINIITILVNKTFSEKDFYEFQIILPFPISRSHRKKNSKKIIIIFIGSNIFFDDKESATPRYDSHGKKIKHRFADMKASVII